MTIAPKEEKPHEKQQDRNIISTASTGDNSSRIALSDYIADISQLKKRQP
jgi:hypothetical protein